MATQRLIVATLAGEAATAVIALFESLSAKADPAMIDRFCDSLRANGFALPVVYFSEWADRWLMGDLVPGPTTVEGRRYQADCLSPAQAIEWAGGCGDQFPEQEWFAARLREAAAGWGIVAEHCVVVIVREVFGPSTTDDEVRATLDAVPAWLKLLVKSAEQGAAADRPRD